MQIRISKRHKLDILQFAKALIKIAITIIYIILIVGYVYIISNNI